MIEDILNTIEESERLWFKILVVFFGILIEIISIFLCCCIVYFEKYGGNVQKRTILNKILSSICLLMIFSNILPLNTFLLRIILGPIPSWLAKILFFYPKVFCGFATMLYLNEMIIIRYLSIFVWKRVPPINDSIFYLIFNLTNAILALVFVLFSNMGYNIEQSLFLLLCGFKEERGETPVFRFYFCLLTLTTLIHLLAGSRLSWNKIKQRQRTQNDIEEQTQETQKEILSFIGQFIVFLLLIIFFVQLVVFSNFSNPVLSSVLLFCVPHLLSTLMIPSFVCISNPDILKFVNRKLCQ